MDGGKGALVEVEGADMRDDDSSSLEVKEDRYGDCKLGGSFGGEEEEAKEWKSVLCLFIATAPHCFQKRTGMAKLLQGEYRYG